MIIEQKSCMENIEAPHLYMGIKLTFLSWSVYFSNNILHSYFVHSQFESEWGF
jgi:hypothetical protein